MPPQGAKWTGHYPLPQSPPGAGGLRWGAGNAAKRPTSADIDPGEAISLLAVVGFLGAFLLGIINPVSACTPLEVTATLAATAVRREAHPQTPPQTPHRAYSIQTGITHHFSTWHLATR